jgi:hypothetical protein
MGANKGLEVVRHVLISALGQYLDISSVINLRYCSHSLHHQYSPQEAPWVWRALALDSADVLARETMTLSGARFLNQMFRIEACQVWGAAYPIMSRASANGNLDLAKWFVAIFGAIGLAGADGTDSCAFARNVYALSKSGCRNGQLEFIVWFFSTFKLEMTVKLWVKMMLRACKNGGYIPVLDWVYRRREPVSWLVTPVKSIQYEIRGLADRTKNVELQTWCAAAFGP